MEKSHCVESEERNENRPKASEPEFFMQWGNRKRLRCVRVKGSEFSARFNGGGIFRKIASSRIHRFAVSSASEKGNPHLQSNPLSRKSEGSMVQSGGGGGGGGNRKSSSPEKEERYYTTRGSVGVDEIGNGNNGEEEGGLVWPKLYITLSSKEKEEDFLAMKGCKLPQRPKKRAKLIQRSLLLVSPGAWLTDMCQERYEVREKKGCKKRPRGLKAMGSLEIESE